MSLCRLEPVRWIAGRSFQGRAMPKWVVPSQNGQHRVQDGFADVLDRVAASNGFLRVALAYRFRVADSRATPRLVVLDASGRPLDDERDPFVSWLTSRSLDLWQLKALCRAYRTPLPKPLEPVRVFGSLEDARNC